MQHKSGTALIRRDSALRINMRHLKDGIRHAGLLAPCTPWKTVGQWQISPNPFYKVNLIVTPIILLSFGMGRLWRNM